MQEGDGYAYNGARDTGGKGKADHEDVETAIFCTIFAIACITICLIGLEFLYNERHMQTYISEHISAISAAKVSGAYIEIPATKVSRSHIEIPPATTSRPTLLPTIPELTARPSSSPSLVMTQESKTHDALYSTLITKPEGKTDKYESETVIVAMCSGYYKQQQHFYIWQLQKYWPFPIKVIHYDDCNTKADVLFCKEQRPQGCIRENQENSAKVFHGHSLYVSKDGVQYNNEYSFKHEKGRPFYISFRSDSALGEDHTNHGSDVVQWGQYFNKFLPNPQVYMCLGCMEVVGQRKNTTSDILKPQGPFPISLAKRKFMLFIVHSGMKHICRKTSHSWNVVMRVAAYDEINENIAQVTSYGGCRRTEREPDFEEFSKSQRKEKNVQLYSNFKFSLTMENEVKSGYFTEKMMNGYFGHSIPIYWGAPDIAKIVNMDRIIHLDISREEMDEAWKLYEEKKGDNGFVLSNEELTSMFAKKHPDWAVREIKKRKAFQFFDNSTNSWKEMDMGWQVEDRTMFVRNHFRNKFDAMKDRIRFLHENEAEYMKIVQMPLVKKLEGSEFDPSVIIERILKTMSSAESYVVNRIPPINQTRYPWLGEKTPYQEATVMVPSLIQGLGELRGKPVTIGLCGGYFKQPTRNYIWQLQRYWPFPVEIVHYFGCETEVDIVFCKSQIPGGCHLERQENSSKAYHKQPLGVSIAGVQYNREFSFKHERGRAFYISFRSDSALGGDHKNIGSDTVQWGQHYNTFGPNPSVYMCLGCTEVIGVRKNTTEDVIRPQGFPKYFVNRRFMLFIVNAGMQHICRKIIHSWNALVRAAAYDEINQRIRKVTSYGKCRNTEKEPVYENNDELKGKTKKELNVRHYSDFKFSLTMENEVKDGYLTEKMFNGYFAKSIPIYWGAPDIAEIINMERIVHLDISRDQLMEAWDLYAKSKGKNKYVLSNDELEKHFTKMHPDWVMREIKKRHAFQFYDNTTSSWKELDAGWEVEDRILFLRKHFKSQFQAMIERIQVLDKDEEEYMRVLQLPMVKKIEGSEFDAGVIIERFLKVLKSADSYVIEHIPDVNRTRYSWLDEKT